MSLKRKLSYFKECYRSEKRVWKKIPRSICNESLPIWVTSSWNFWGSVVWWDCS